VPPQDLLNHPTTLCSLEACKLAEPRTVQLRRCDCRATVARCGKLCPDSSGQWRPRSSRATLWNKLSELGGFIETGAKRRLNVVIERPRKWAKPACKGPSEWAGRSCADTENRRCSAHNLSVRAVKVLAQY